MRKRRRLANKMTIMVCAVLLAFSAFFYAPIEVEASDFSFSGDLRPFYPMNGSLNDISINVHMGSGFDNNEFYRVYFDYDLVFSTDVVTTLRSTFLNYNNGNVFSFQTVDPPEQISHHFTGNAFVTLKGSLLNSGGFRFYTRVLSVEGNSPSSYTVKFNHNITGIILLTGEESASYQQGYNAGYSAGEEAGESNGYSSGYSDGYDAGEQSGYDSGFQAGSDSVDTQSYYDAGYSAGYDAGYVSGYDDGYDSGYDDGWNAYEQRISGWGADTADYPVIVYENSFSNLKVLCDINTNIPQISYGNFYFPQFNFAVNPNHTYKVVFNSSTYTKASAHASGSQSDNIVYNLGSLELPWYIGESYAFIPGSQFTSNVRLDCYIYGAVYDDGSNSSNFETWSAQYVLTFKSIDIKVYDMGPSGDTQNHIANQTDQLTNGYDDSKGNTVNSELSTGLNEYETVENSLFATATTGMKDFTFFDFESVPAMITGMSFIGSIMGSWFNQAGGASGVGIVLSILFSVILVAMVLGLYRWYQSRGGKN